VAADGSGQYLFTDVPDGTYTITPTRTAYTFTPASKTITLGGADAGGVDFTGALASNVVFFDDFQGTAIDTGQWTVMNREGDTGNGEVQCYTPANATATGGNLQITSQVQASTCSGNSYNYTSAMLQWTTFNFTYGTVEMRAKMAGGQGTWPALWLLGANCQASNVNSADNVAPCNWPSAGSDEIDITEIKGGALNTVWQNVISGSSGFQTCTPTTTDVSQNWHTYGLVWAPGSLTWTIDGVQTCRFTKQIPSTPMFLMINTAMGGGGGGTINNATLPQTLLVDYVKVSK
jgi:beta-glucanase (GH16 family)